MKLFNQHSRIRKLMLASAFVAFGLAQQNAYAVGTASNTTITNLSTLSYSVGGVAQPNIGSSAAGNTSGAGTATTFLVDKKVNVVVAEVGGAVTIVAPAQTAAVTTFTVTNTGNDPQDFNLAATNRPNGTTLFAGTDNFDATACATFVENGATAGYQVAQDTGTFVDELVANGAGSTATVYVVCNIPGAQINNDQAVVTLTADVRAGGGAGLGAVLTNNTATANTAGVDNVFADAAGSDDAVNSGSHSARDAYRVSAATLTVSKTAQLVCDPVTGTSTPHNVPGGVVRWTITIANAAGSGSANLAQVLDTLDANTAFDVNLITGAGGTAGCVSATGTPENAAGRGFKLDVTGDTRPGTYPKFLTTAADADGATHAAGAVTVDYAAGMPVETGYTAGELKGGESAVVYFNVTIN